MNIGHNSKNKEVNEDLRNPQSYGILIPFPGKTIINPMKLQFLYRSIFSGDNDNNTLCLKRNSK